MSTPDLSSSSDASGAGVRPPTQAADLDARVEVDLLRLIFARSPFTHVTSMVNACLCAFLVRDAVPTARNLAWLGIVLVVASFRIGLRQAYWRRPPGPAENRRWQRLSVLGGSVFGAAWGSMALLIYPEDAPIWQMLQTIAIGAACCVASGYSASHLPTFFGFVIPASVPLVVVHLAHADSFHVILSVLLFVVVLQAVSVAVATERAFREAARLRYELASVNQTLESKVTARTADLAAALTARDEFIWVASHELRTPVTSLLLSAQNIERLAHNDSSPNAPRNARAAATIVRQSRQLARLIEEMFDGAVIEAGGMELRTESSVDLAGVARAAIARLAHEATQSGSSIELEVPSGSVLGCWDRALLEKAIVHVLSNAIKFGRGQPIRVAVEQRDGLARVEVVDHGMGIAPAEQARIFERFHRGVPARHFGGLGLGLYVVRQIVTRHGGAITFESAPERGTAITLELPRTPDASAAHVA